jgi:hypothetical protein
MTAAASFGVAAAEALLLMGDVLVDVLKRLSTPRYSESQRVRESKGHKSKTVALKLKIA